MTTTPPVDDQHTSESAPVTVIPGSPQPAPVACLLVSAVDEKAGTLTGHWIDLDVPPAVTPNAVLVLDRTSTSANEPGAEPDQRGHRTTSLFRWTDDGPVKVAEWCGLNGSWPMVIAHTAAFWLTRRD